MKHASGSDAVGAVLRILDEGEGLRQNLSADIARIRQSNKSDLFAVVQHMNVILTLAGAKLARRGANSLRVSQYAKPQQKTCY